MSQPMRAVIHEDLLSEIEAFCAANGVSKSTFGKKALGDPSFVSQLAAGRECRRATVQAVRQFIDTAGEGAKDDP